MIDQKALEAVAAIEHDQWAHWTRYMLDNLTPENARRWDWQCVTPYNELSETEKDSDRKWAVKSITAYEAAKPQPDQEALELVLDYAGKGHGYTVKERQTAIAKLRGIE